MISISEAVTIIIDHPRCFVDLLYLNSFVDHLNLVPTEWYPFHSRLEGVTRSKKWTPAAHVANFRETEGHNPALQKSASL